MYETPPDTEGEYWRDMEERYNIDYQPEWVPVTSYVDRLSLLVSTNDLPDVIRVEQVTAPWTVKAAEAGMFKDLTDYLKPEDYPNLCALNPAAWTNSKYKGRNYLFPNSRGQYNNCYFLRGDLLEKYGLSRPETVDELTAYFEAIAQEPGMVPVPSNLDSPIELVQAAFGPGNILPVYTDDGTGIVPFQLTESYAQAVEYMAQLYSKGLVSQEFALLNGDQTEDLMLSGKGGIYSKTRGTATASTRRSKRLIQTAASCRSSASRAPAAPAFSTTWATRAAFPSTAVWTRKSSCAGWISWSRRATRRITTTSTTASRACTTTSWTNSPR